MQYVIVDQRGEKPVIFCIVEDKAIAELLVMLMDGKAEIQVISNN